MANVTISQDIANTIVDPFAYADGTAIDEAFKVLRREDPFGVAQPEGFDPFWVATKFEHIQEIEKQNDLFHNGDRATIVTPVEVDKMVRDMMGGSPHLVRSLVQMDNPDHHNYRTLTQSWFMPQNLRKLEDRIREIAVTFVNRMVDYGSECDFARDVAFLYPLHVIMEVLGVPEADEPKMLKLTQELFGSADPEMNRTGEISGESTTEAFQAGLAAMGETIGEFFEYFNAITDDRRANPRDDVSSTIANGKIDGEPLGHLEAMSYYIIAATAGHDTTSATTAGAMWAMCEAPEQFAQVRDDPAKIIGLVEESIRWVTPVKHFMRTATADAEVAGKKIAKGDWLMLSYPSGNRDEDIYDEPFKFDVTRAPNRHVAMGYGAHVCLGQHLARMEMRIFWEEFFKRIKSVEMNGTPSRMAANFVCGPKSVPVRFTLN